MKNRPLADILRPDNLEDVIGQDHLFGESGPLSTIIKSKNVPSMILWGPPGVGKTTIAKALAKISDAEFVVMSAINSGAADIRKVIEKAQSESGKSVDLEDDGLFVKEEKTQEKSPKKTILMIDEIHHFNKTQQDLFLPFIEDGTIILIGTTTENPSFQLNSALLSRCKVITLKILDEVALEKIMQRAEKILGKELPLTVDAREALINLSCGDARYLLNACEELFLLNLKSEIPAQQLMEIISKRAAHFDKKGEFHFNLIRII